MVNRIIHQITGPRATEFINSCLHSWIIVEQYDFKVMVWTDSLIRDFLKKNYLFAFEAYIQARNPGESSDIARYLITHFYGGYYVDWDIQLLDVEAFILLHNYCPNGYLLIDVKTGVISCEHFSVNTNETFLLNLVNDIVELFDCGKRDQMDTPNYSGPHRMSESIKKHNNFSQSVLKIKDVFEYDYFEIRSASGNNFSKPMIHYWLHTWM